MDYPAFPQLVGSQQQWVDDIAVDVAVNGRPMARAFYSAKRRQFNLIHMLDDADVATLEAFYDANRLSDDITLQWKCGPSYTVMFDSAPRINWGNPYHRVEVSLRKVD